MLSLPENEKKSIVWMWETYYPIIRTDARFLGYKTDKPMIDTRFGRVRCGKCHRRQAGYHPDVKYCAFCGERISGYTTLKPKDEFDIVEYAEKYDIPELIKTLERIENE